MINLQLLLSYLHIYTRICPLVGQSMMFIYLSILSTTFNVNKLDICLNMLRTLLDLGIYIYIKQTKLKQKLLVHGYIANTQYCHYLNVASH